MSILRLIIAITLAIIIGKFVSKMGLPAILGWLVTGMIVGPFALKLINQPMLDSSGYKILMSILECTVGIMIGGELVISKLRKSGKQVMITTIFQSLITFAFVSLCFYIIFKWLNMPTYLAFIFGAIALATAPAPALSIVKEFNTKGPITDTLIPLAAIDDIIGIIVFFSVISLVNSVGSNTQTPLLVTLFIMIVAPILLGLCFGILAGKVMNHFEKERDDVITVIASVIVLAVMGIFINKVLIGSDMINFMLLGMAFAAGFSNIITEVKQERVMKNIAPIISLALVVVILNLGVPLNYKFILGAGGFTLIYMISRAIGKYCGAYIGAKYTGMSKTVQKYLGLTLLPHSGVSLVFTGIAVSAILPFDPASAKLLQGTIAAAAVINEIIAVIVSKKAFEWSGEING